MYHFIQMLFLKTTKKVLHLIFCDTYPEVSSCDALPVTLTRVETLLERGPLLHAEHLNLLYIQNYMNLLLHFSSQVFSQVSIRTLRPLDPYLCLSPIMWSFYWKLYQKPGLKLLEQGSRSDISWDFIINKWAVFTAVFTCALLLSQAFSCFLSLCWKVWCDLTTVCKARCSSEEIHQRRCFQNGLYFCLLFK